MKSLFPVNGTIIKLPLKTEDTGLSKSLLMLTLSLKKGKIYLKILLMNIYGLIDDYFLRNKNVTGLESLV